jgi:hypothetical protein
MGSPRHFAAHSGFNLLSGRIVARRAAFPARSAGRRTWLGAVIFWSLLAIVCYFTYLLFR